MGSSSLTSPLPDRSVCFIGVVLRWKRGLYALGHAGVRLSLALAGIRYRVVGREHVPPSAVVFCSNHESNVDPPVLFMTLHPYLHILYKAELRQFPIMGTVLDVGGFVPIERADREKAAESIARGAESLQAGQLVSDLSRRHAQPHRAAVAVQEGWLHHGHSGTGAGCSGFGAGREGRDAERKRSRTPRPRQRPNRQADSDRRASPRKTAMSSLPGYGRRSKL